MTAQDWQWTSSHPAWDPAIQQISIRILCMITHVALSCQTLLQCCIIVVNVSVEHTYITLHSHWSSNGACEVTVLFIWSEVCQGTATCMSQWCKINSMCVASRFFCLGIWVINLVVKDMHMQIHPLPVNVHSLTCDCRCTGNLNKLPKCGRSPCLFSSGFQGLSRLCSTGLPFHSVIEVHLCLNHGRRRAGHLHRWTGDLQCQMQQTRFQSQLVALEA